MNDALVWIHGDDLNPLSRSLQAYPDAPRVFVFDDAVLAHYQLSIKRIAFMYECLLEIPRIDIRRGDVAAELAAAAREAGCTRIVTTTSIAPRFARLCMKLQREYKLPVETIAPEPFVELSASEETRLDLKRFSRFWNPIKTNALGTHASPRAIK